MSIIWKEIGESPYLFGSKLMEENTFTPDIITANNRNPSLINGYVTTNNKVDLTNKSTITIKITSYYDGVVGIGASTTKPTSVTACGAVSTKNAVSVPQMSNGTTVITYDVSALSGEYYLFTYITGGIDAAVIYWKVE